MIGTARLISLAFSLASLDVFFQDLRNIEDGELKDALFNPSYSVSFLLVVILLDIILLTYLIIPIGTLGGSILPYLNSIDETLFEL